LIHGSSATCVARRAGMMFVIRLLNNIPTQ